MKTYLLSVSLLLPLALLTASAQTSEPGNTLTQSPNASCTPAPLGLVSWWPGDGNANDIKGGNNGTLFNTSFVAAEVGQGFSFASATGTQTGVSIGNPSNLQLNASLTIDFWLKRSDATRVTNYQNGTGGACVFCYGTGGYSVGLFPDGTIGFGKQDASIVSSSSLKITDTNFHHVAVTKSGSTVVLYLDGVAANVGPYDPGFTFTTDLAIGTRGDDGTSGFLGVMDEVDVYSRSLTAAEIQVIFAAGTGGKCKPTTVQFSAVAYPVNESGPDATVTVTRVGDTSGASTVDYATSDTAGTNNCGFFNGSASSRCDYLSTLGTLHFAANETLKTISIPIIDDSYAEGPETFAIQLSNPIGASLGAPTVANITITDNDATNGPNPIDPAGFFVRQHYVDFLNREPDQSGLNFWMSNITSCGNDQTCIGNQRINVSAAFFISIEFQQTGYLVERTYKTSYGDASGNSTFGGAHQIPVPIVRLNEFLSDTQEIGQGVVVNQGNWQQQLEDNKQAFTAEFVQRARFTTAFPSNMTADQFVDKLNTNAGSPLSQSERDQLVIDLSSNAKTRAQVLRAVAEHQNLVNSEFNRAFVLMQYFGYLRRNPNDPQDSDYTGYDFWLGKLNGFTQSGDDVLVRVQKAEMVKAFITSIEYRARFGPA